MTLGVHLQPNLETQTFEPDLRAVIADLVLDVLEDAPERTEVEFAAARSANGQDIVVSAVRSGAPVPDDVMMALQQCVLLPGELRQRWRSLVVLWSLARNIGVRLGVEVWHGRNQISFLIPVIRL
jgi:hypothetical protein